jgi:REase_AHJR-like protein
VTTASIRERYALEVFEPIWREKGYTVVREPHPHQLPQFLQGFKPDAIALGVEPSLVIEVVSGQGPVKESMLRRLKSALDGHDGWRLEVIYVGSEGAPIKPASLDSVRQALSRARSLAEGDPEAALLLAWAGIEAIGRMLHPELAEYSLGALALVDLLVGYGHLSQEEGSALRAVGAKRNRIAHGELESPPEVEDVDALSAIAGQLIGEIDRSRPA